MKDRQNIMCKFYLFFEHVNYSIKLTYLPGHKSALIGVMTPISVVMFLQIFCYDA